MKKIVLNLARRQDRKDKFNERNIDKLTNYQFATAIDGKQIDIHRLYQQGVMPQQGWRDPFHNQKIRKGEVGCFLSHWNAWQTCLNENEPIMVLEDDAVITDDFDEFEIQKLAAEYDFIYLQRNENEPEKVVRIDDKLEVPAYPYNLTAYVITPTAAKFLTTTNILRQLIPVDEYLPLAIPKMKVAAFKKDVVTQASREELGSDIEDDDYFIDFTVHPITVGTDRKKCIPVNDSGAMNGIYPKNIGENVDWFNDMSGPAGGKKVNLLKDHIEDMPDHDVILFTDAYDVFYADDIETITQRWLSFNSRAVFSAERHCYPKPELADKYTWVESPYRFLNSGTFMAEVGELKRMFEQEMVEDSDDDQLFYTKRFLSKKHNIVLDHEQYIFQTHDEAVEKKGSQLFNPHTNCYGCIYHGNGGEDSKGKFDKLYNEFYPKQPTIFIPKHGKVDLLERDMIIADFMTQSQCEDLIAMADKHGGWEPHPDDKFPAQEIRLKELGLWEECEKQWEKYLYPIIEQYWSPMQMYGLREAFIMRYALDTQVSLANHCDASMVTGSVKLNDDYEGADLVFHRQNVSNKDVPVGRVILFPGQVTHGHECMELKSGVKYSLTMWTQRYKGDLL